MRSWSYLIQVRAQFEDGRVEEEGVLYVVSLPSDPALLKDQEELRELIEKESNEYKKNALKSELRSVEDARKLLTNLIQSLQSEPSSCEGANGRNPEQGRGSKASSVAWQVLRVALLFPILGRILPRDLSPLKPVLVEGVWDRVRKRLVPLEAGGASR